MEAQAPKQQAPDVKGADFPALPSDAPQKEGKDDKEEKPKPEAAYTAAVNKGVKKGLVLPPDALPLSPPVGRWDDEMEAYDERTKNGSA